MGAKSSKQRTSCNPPAYEQLSCDNIGVTHNISMHGIEPSLKKTKYEESPTVCPGNESSTQCNATVSTPISRLHRSQSGEMSLNLSVGGTVTLNPSLIFVNTEQLTEEPLKVSQLYEYMGDFYKEQNNAYKAEYNRLCKEHICTINSELKKNARDGVYVSLYMPEELTNGHMLQIPDKYISNILNKHLLKAVWAFIKKSYAEYIITDEIHKSWRICAKIYVPNIHNFDVVSK